MNDATPLPGDDRVLVEEEWEAEIASLLGGMPMVSPPDGFISKALDRRPLYAGRSILVASMVSVVASLVIFGSGVLADEIVVPDLEALVNRHSLTEASLFEAVIPLGSTEQDGYVFELIDDVPSIADSPVLMPSGFEVEATFKGRNMGQTVFTSGGDAVSVFFEPGQVDFGWLSQEGWTKIDGINAWSDPRRDLVIFQTADSAVTIVGLQPEMLGEVVVTLDPESDLSTWKSVGQRLNRVTRELGFTDLVG